MVEVSQDGAPLRGEPVVGGAGLLMVSMGVRDVGLHQGVHPRVSFMMRVIRCPRYALAAPSCMSIITS